jgi:hypothetical protein
MLTFLLSAPDPLCFAPLIPAGRPPPYGDRAGCCGSPADGLINGGRMKHGFALPRTDVTGDSPVRCAADRSDAGIEPEPVGCTQRPQAAPVSPQHMTFTVG